MVQPSSGTARCAAITGESILSLAKMLPRAIVLVAFALLRCKRFGPGDTTEALSDGSLQDCTVYVACRQLRTRDCHNLRFSTHCATQPSIETSSALRFSKWAGSYPGLSDHFKARSDFPHAAYLAPCRHSMPGRQLTHRIPLWHPHACPKSFSSGDTSPPSSIRTTTRGTRCLTSMRDMTQFRTGASTMERTDCPSGEQARWTEKHPPTHIAAAVPLP